MFRVSTTPIIRGTQNCNYSLRYWSYFLCSYIPTTWQSFLLSGVHKTVTTASGTGHIFCAAATLQSDKAWPRWREVAAVPEAVVTVLCTPDDEFG